MAELINEKDSLNEGRKKINKAISKSNIADSRSQFAFNLANQAIEKSNSTQEQLDTIVIDGDSSVEAAQARVDAENNTFSTLKERLDTKETEFSSQLAQTDQLIKSRERFLRYGRLTLPKDFPNLPFNIYKTGQYEFSHDATPQNQHDWSNATNIYIANETSGGSELDGTNPELPIAFSQFVARVSDGTYGSQKNFIVNIKDDFITTLQFTGASALKNTNANLLIKSSSDSGFTWFTRAIKQGDSQMTNWSHQGGGVYKTTLSAPLNVVPNNYMELDAFGTPLPYVYKDDITEVESVKGSYHINGVDVYVNPFSNHRIEDVYLDRTSQMMDASDIGNQVIIFENVGFTTSQHTFSGTSEENSVFYFFNCRFARGLQHNFAVTGKYKIFLFNCVASHASRDAFNYHSETNESLAVEINCKGFGAGKYKIPGGNTNNQSNNGSTAHDGMYMLRVGGVYWECEGPIVADVGNCYSISIGCQSYDLLDSVDSTIRTGFYFFNPQGITESEEKPKYIIDCLQSGKYLDYGIYSIRSTKTYYQNFIGSQTTYATHPPIEIYWEEVAG